MTQSKRSITAYRVSVAINRARPGERLTAHMQFDAINAIALYAERYDYSYAQRGDDNHVVVTHGARNALALKRACERAGVDAAIVERRFEA